MKKRQILTVVFLILSLGMSLFLYFRIDSKNQEIKFVKKNEEHVKLVLLAYRDLQKSYLGVNKRYANSWEDLSSFIFEGNFFVTEKVEHVKTLSYGADSIWFTVDTLETIPVLDSIKNAPKFKLVNLQRLGELPHDKSKKFEIYAGEIEGVQVFEIMDAAPVDPERQKSGKKQALKIGSRTMATTKGNWEK